MQAGSRVSGSTYIIMPKAVLDRSFSAWISMSRRSSNGFCFHSNQVLQRAGELQSGQGHPIGPSSWIGGSDLQIHEALPANEMCGLTSSARHVGAMTRDVCETSVTEWLEEIHSRQALDAPTA